MVINRKILSISQYLLFGIKEPRKFICRRKLKKKKKLKEEVITCSLIQGIISDIRDKINIYNLLKLTEILLKGQFRILVHNKTLVWEQQRITQPHKCVLNSLCKLFECLYMCLPAYIIIHNKLCLSASILSSTTCPQSSFLFPLSEAWLFHFKEVICYLFTTTKIK